MEYNEVLKLENQLCFPLYASSRLVTRMYQPLLEKLDITYTQYLILLVLWEKNGLTIKEIGGKLLLETNTLTPLLKRMENKGILIRERSKADERKVYIHLTELGISKKKEALCIPGELFQNISKSFPIEKVIQLREDLNELISLLTK
ncbi:MAG: MarR family transcriptional regulator [Spirochaetaceae bacterium]|jgi:MarR family transcriptional regulator|nr:MarR family transcriptional regulator [Spirochaetaceae bacterium]